MTTIATDGKTMAADSRGCADSVIRSDHEQKIRRLKDGRIVGFSGTAAAARTYLNWLEEGGEMPKVDDGFSALVLSMDGTVQVHCNDEMPDDADLPAVLGSGGLLALGAMLAGASPEQAVAIAAQRDPFTGGEIRVLSRALLAEAA